MVQNMTWKCSSLAPHEHLPTYEEKLTQELPKEDENHMVFSNHIAIFSMAVRKHPFANLPGQTCALSCIFLRVHISNKCQPAKEQARKAIHQCSANSGLYFFILQSKLDISLPQVCLLNRRRHHGNIHDYLEASTTASPKHK